MCIPTYFRRFRWSVYTTSARLSAIILTVATHLSLMIMSDAAGLTYPQYLVMMVLWEKDHQPVNDIAKRLLLETNTATPLLQRMEKSGLVVRHKGNQDGRQMIVSLTPRGKGLEETLADIPERIGGAVLCDCINEKTFSSRWSERHAAFVCGLGTFGLSKGVITRKGTAGRFTSIIIPDRIEPDTRAYTGIYEWCVRCGACARRCPAEAITLEEGKDHNKCYAFQLKTGKLFYPRYGCGLCQTKVPCEARAPGLGQS